MQSRDDRVLRAKKRRQEEQLAAQSSHRAGGGTSAEEEEQDDRPARKMRRAERNTENSSSGNIDNGAGGWPHNAEPVGFGEGERDQRSSRGRSSGTIEDVFPSRRGRGGKTL